MERNRLKEKDVEIHMGPFSPIFAKNKKELRRDQRMVSRTDQRRTNGQTDRNPCCFCLIILRVSSWFLSSAVLLTVELFRFIFLSTKFILLIIYSYIFFPSSSPRSPASRPALYFLILDQTDESTTDEREHLC